MGGSDDPGAIGPKHWERAAEDWEMSAARILEIVRESARALAAAIAELPAEASRLGVPKRSALLIRDLIKKQVRRSESALRGEG